MSERIIELLYGLVGGCAEGRADAMPSRVTLLEARLGAAGVPPPAAPSNHSRLGRDFRARCRDGPPASAEVNEALTVDVAGLFVRLEEVERVTLVGDLQLPVLALCRAEQRRVQAGAGSRLPGDERRPVRRALSVAHALRALVGGKEIQRAPIRTDEHLSDCRRLQRDRRRLCRRESGCRHDTRGDRRHKDGELDLFHLDSSRATGTSRMPFDTERSASPLTLKVAPVNALVPSLVTAYAASPSSP